MNLALLVGPVRQDGYHPLATVFLALSLYDDLTFEPADGIELALSRPDPRIPLDERNLAAQAARLLARTGGLDPAARITIDKAIPVAGGMAGGSADAAATLVGCNELWRLGMERAELEKLAAELGADVPFALRGGCASGTNRGDHLTDVATGGQFHWVAVIDEQGLSTAEVYRAFDRRRGAGVPAPKLEQGMLDALAAGDPVALGRCLANDLEPDAIALRPTLAGTKATMAELGLAAIVSGSGPSVLGLAASAAAADSAAASLRVEYGTERVLRAEGPVPGARVS